MKPHDNGQQMINFSDILSKSWREDVEVEAVLSAEDEEVPLREDDVALYAGRALAAETGEAATAVLHSIPTLGFLWQRKPGEKSNGQVGTIKNMTAIRMEIPQISCGWLRVRYPTEREVGDFRHFRFAAATANFSLCSFHSRRRSHRKKSQCACCQCCGKNGVQCKSV